MGVKKACSVCGMMRILARSKKRMCMGCRKARGRKARARAEGKGKPIGLRRMSFHQKVEALGYRSYNDYLAGEHWQDFRGRYKASTRPQTCAVCGASSVSLHHVSYDRLGCERLSDVIPLCQPHHEALHVLLRARRWGVRRTAEAVAVLKGG